MSGRAAFGRKCNHFTIWKIVDMVSINPRFVGYSGGFVTICVGVQVNDCLVFAADSAVTLSYGTAPNGTEIINVLRHGHKVFNLHRDLPICAMTCGLGNIGPGF